jgi:hypothetical protein
MELTPSWTTHFLPGTLRLRHASPDPLPQHLAFEFGHSTQHLKGQSSRGQSRIDILL